MRSDGLDNGIKRLTLLIHDELGCHSTTSFPTHPGQLAILMPSLRQRRPPTGSGLIPWP